MKNLMIRAFVVALAVAGVSASATNVAITKHHAISATSAGVVPMCKPSDPHGCGLDQQ